MDKLILSLLIVFIFWDCKSQSNKIKENFASKVIPIFVIEQPILYQALDSVISYEKRCSSYHIPLIFGFTVKDSVFWFTNYPEAVDILSWTTYKGCFKYRDHLFLSDDIGEPWFEKTDKYQRFSYKKVNKLPPPTPPMNDSGTIIKIEAEKIIVRMKCSCGE